MTAGEAVLLAGTALLAVAVPVAFLRTRASLAAQLAGAALLAAGAVVVLATGEPVGAALRSTPDPALGLDGLSAFFLAVVALSTVPVALAAADDLGDTPRDKALTALTAAFPLTLAGVLAARDVVTFLASWELMTLVPATAILVARRDAPVREAVFAYLAVTHVGGAGVWIAMLTLAHAGALGGAAVTGGLQALVLVAAIVGFGTKAGLMPFHAWLPRAHPIAPTHISALMSGAMLKVAIYGLVRVAFEWAGPAPRWAGIVLVALGAVSACAGILAALVDRDMKRLLAFSSIENVGIVVLGLGAAILLADGGQTGWAALAFAGALLHVANHAAFKGLLFLGAGAIGRAAGTFSLDGLGGVWRRMPWTGGAVLVGCAAIAGLPPLNGFTSEWVTLQGLLHVGQDGAAGVAVTGALATAALAATAALGAFCFVKLAGLVLLGAPRTAAADRAPERPAATRAALGLGAGACVALAVAAPALLHVLANLSPWSAAAPTGGLAAPIPGTGSLAPAALLAALGLGTLLVARLAAAGRPRAAVAPAWTCGQPVDRSLAWTSAGFTKPLQLVLASVLRPRRTVATHGAPALVTGVRHEAEVARHFDIHLYAPVRRAALRGARAARRLQSGSLRAYVLQLLALVLGLECAVRIGLLG